MIETKQEQTLFLTHDEHDLLFILLLNCCHLWLVHRKTAAPATKGPKGFRTGRQSRSDGVWKGDKGQERKELRHCEGKEWVVSHGQAWARTAHGYQRGEEKRREQSEPMPALGHVLVEHYSIVTLQPVTV